MNTLRSLVAGLFLAACLPGLGALADKSAEPNAQQVLDSLRDFFRKCARPDGSFQPGVDPEYEGISDSAYSDLAPTAYAVILHRTFGWKLPHEEKTRDFLLGRQRKDGSFFNVAGTVDPDSAAGKAYNTTMALVALRGLGVKPTHDPLPVFDVVLQADYKDLPLYMTSFFPLAYLTAGKAIPPEADKKIRALMVQAEDGFLNDHIAATFHAVHYYRLVGEKTPKAEAILKRTLREQKPNGGWLLNPPARDRHATFDAVFTLRHLAADRPEVRKAMERAAKWILSCRNPDGGFGHYPGSASDADACYFHVGALVMSGRLSPSQPPPAAGHLLGWGHLMPAPGQAKDDAKELPRLEGAWTAVSWKRGEAEVGKDKVKTELVFTKDAYEFPVGINRFSKKGAYKIDPAKAAIDFTPADGAAKGKTLLGIYKIENGVLTLCFSSAGNDRPTEFKTGDRNTVLATYERKK